MDFQLTEEQKMFQSMVRDFAQTEIEPLAAKIDQDEMIPPDLCKKMGETGLLGIAINEKYGGSGGDYISQAIASEEISRASGSVGAFFIAHLSLATNPIVHSASEEQKQKYLPGIAHGKTINCFGLTETNAGSDAGALQTTATPKGDTFVLNGNKIFITNGAEANICTLFATVDKSAGYRGICAFIVEKDRPGFSVGKLEHKMGIRGSSTAELIFDNCVIPSSNMFGEKGKGLRIALEAIDASRINVAAQAIGIAQAAYDDALAYAKNRKQFNSPLTGFQSIQWMLADMATSLETARLLIYKSS